MPLIDTNNSALRYCFIGVRRRIALKQRQSCNKAHSGCQRRMQTFGGGTRGACITGASSFRGVPLATAAAFGPESSTTVGTKLVSESSHIIIPNSGLFLFETQESHPPLPMMMMTEPEKMGYATVQQPLAGAESKPRTGSNSS